MIQSRTDYIRWKRIFDLLFSLSLILLLLPLSLPFFLLISWETRAWPVFVQQRGKSLEGKLFRIYKLRTMREHGTGITPFGSGIFSKPHLAGYVPAFCGWLRRSGLDELPQLWNILIGDMSFIGPRPLATGDLEVMKRDFPSLYRERASLRAKVGLSGLWQLFGSREEGVENLVRLDSEYERARSFRTDMKLIVKSIPTVLFALHSDAILKRGRVDRAGVVEEGSLPQNIVTAQVQL